MKRQSAIWAVFLLLPLAALAADGDPKNDADAKDMAPAVQKFVAQLDAAEVAARDEAEAGLTKLGPAALAHLPRITARMSPELKVRLARVRGALELAYAQAAGRPSTITLAADGLKLSQVLAAIEKQSGNKIVDRRADDDRFDPVLKGKYAATPFWQVMDDVLDQAKLAIDPHAADDEGNPVPGVAIVRRPKAQSERRNHVSYSGPLRVEATSISSRRDLKSPDTGQLKVTLGVSWEPQLSPVAMSLPGQHVKAVDDLGKTLAVHKTKRPIRKSRSSRGRNHWRSKSRSHSRRGRRNDSRA